MAQLIPRGVGERLTLTSPVLSEPVTLRRVGQFVRISPAIVELERTFRTVYHSPRDDLGAVPGVVKLIHPLVCHTQDSRGNSFMQSYAELEPLLIELLQRLGVTYVLTGDRPKNLPKPKLETLARLGHFDSSMLAFVRAHDRGLIRYDPAGKVSHARLIYQIAMAWMKLRVIVATTRVDDARRLVRQLGKLGLHASLFTSRHNNSHGRRVSVGTYSMLGQGSVGLRRRDIYIALNPGELFQGGEWGKWGLEGIKILHRARLYGLLPTEVTLPTRLCDFVTALFGLEQVIIPKHGYSPLPVQVLFSRIEGGNRPANHKDDASIKKVGIWEHPVRNRRIVHLAQAIAAQDGETVQVRYPELANLLGNCNGMRVGVLVDTVDHGLHLAEQLNWPLVAASRTCTDGLSTAQQTLLAQGRAEQQRIRQPVVVTSTGLARAGRFDVLIRADGGTGLPAIPASKLRIANGQEGGLLLIDFQDRHHPLLRRWSKQRRIAYLEAGWPVAGHEASPLDTFLSTRPEVYA